MQLKERQQSILSAIVREYVRTARPVASQDLMQERDLGVGSATIRNEMLALNELGYLEQPYTSAGRVPTDKGYRFFVDYLLEYDELDKRERAKIRELFAGSDGGDVFVNPAPLQQGAVSGGKKARRIILQQDQEAFSRCWVKEFIRTISQMAGAFAAAGLFDDELFYDVGFSQILKEPEFRDRAYLESFGKLVDLLGDMSGSLCLEARNASEVTVFIGKENPLREGRGHAMIISSWQHPAGFEGFLTLIGPKRMDYGRTISLLRYIRERE